jgi:hypothetical protein
MKSHRAADRGEQLISSLHVLNKSSVCSEFGADIASSIHQVSYPID